MQHYYDAVYRVDVPCLRELLRATRSEGEKAAALGALQAAIQYDIHDVIQEYLAESFDVNSRDVNGGTPLIWAATKGNTSLVEQLVGAGADIHVADSDGMTALLYAAFYQHTTTVQVLIDAGADAYHRNIEGQTALDLARLRWFKVPSIPPLGPGYGVVRRLWDSPTARLLVQLHR